MFEEKGIVFFKDVEAANGGSSIIAGNNNHRT